MTCLVWMWLCLLAAMLTRRNMHQTLCYNLRKKQGRWGYIERKLASSLCIWRWSSYFSFHKISWAVAFGAFATLGRGSQKKKILCQKFIRLSDSHLDVCARPGKWGLTKLTFGQLKNDWCQLISQEQNWLKSFSLCPTGEIQVTWSSVPLAQSFATLIFCETDNENYS